ncbi:unnamed protein product [Spirodela intermedia]|uniref:Uncharacterized protein n=1 Tax=Spirodela intermedia TaxID=51605 RepID=A0A7I8KUM7_SPIIN|nr:unnamed protein product [Spirodela intermedia]
MLLSKDAPFNFDEKCFESFSEIKRLLTELRNEAYENHRIYKEKTKTFHDKYISRKKIDVRQKTLNAALHGRQLTVFISFCLIFFLSSGVRHHSHCRNLSTGKATYPL